MGPASSGKLGESEIALLREFIVIVDAGGLSAAEPRLNKGKSAISLNLKKLETRLGMTLCVRGRGGFRLTEEGRVAHSAAVQLLAELDRFGSHIANASSTLSGSVSFHADDSFLFAFERPIANAIAKLTTNHPRLRLDIKMGDPEQVRNAVLEGTAELGFSVAPRQTDLLSYTPLLSEQLALFCGRGHPLFATQSATSLEEIGQFRAIETYMDHAPAVKPLLKNMNFVANAPTILARVQLLLSGAYIGFLPHAVAEPWLARGELSEILVPGSRFDNPGHLITRRADPEKPLARLLKEALIEEARKFLKDGPIRSEVRT